MRISVDAEACVLSFGPAVPHGGLNQYSGTGFALSLDRDGIRSHFLVTCGHVAKRLETAGRFLIRANLKAGGAELHLVEDVHWIYHADETVDVAAMPFELPNTFDHAAYTVEWPIDDARISAHCGDPINIVGLLRLHVGTNVSTPIVCCGHVALTPRPNRKIPIRDRMTGNRTEIEAYLVEAHTNEGLAGSPVFYHYFAGSGEMELPQRGYSAERRHVNLLGIYIGAWDGESGEFLAKDKNWSGDQRVPQSMGLVVPLEKIVELIVNHAPFSTNSERPRESPTR